MCRLLVTANIPSSPILVTVMKEALSFSETSVLTRATQGSIPEDGILHSHRRDNLKSYLVKDVGTQVCSPDSTVSLHYMPVPLHTELQ
jgi:hypothetical protein